MEAYCSPPSCHLSPMPIEIVHTIAAFTDAKRKNKFESEFVQAGIQTKEFFQPTAPLPPTLIWSKLKAEALNGYTSRLQQYVNQSPSVLPSCNSQCICKNHSCTQSLQEEYDYLISCLKRADSSLPRFKPGVQKDWWTADLTELRNQSIEIHSLWVNEGRPHQGPTHEERLRVRASYKRAIRSAQRAPKQAAWDRLHSSLIDHDTNDFWKTWRQLYNKTKASYRRLLTAAAREKPLLLHSCIVSIVTLLLTINTALTD